MDKLILPGRLFFAIGMIGLAVLSFIYGDFIVGRPPEWPGTMSGKSIAAYAFSTILVIACLAIIFNIKARTAALIIGLLILIFNFLLRNVPDLVGKSAVGILWSLNAYKTLSLAGGAFIVASSFSETHGHNKRFISNENLLLTGTIFQSIFLIIGGFSHFKFAGFVKDFIPAYIPFHGFWAYFCGIALIAGGIGILIKQTRTLAALLSGIMILGWFLLLHIPRFINAPNDPSDRMGLCESFAISGIMFVLAGAFRRKQS